MPKFILTLILAFLPALAFTQQESGEEIMRRSFNRDDGQDAYFKMEMTLIDKTGGPRQRVLELFTKEDYGPLIKSYLKFIQPADINGTVFLSMENESGDDTQYLYLPDLGRARRIVSSQKNLRFVNTDFTYEDMQRRRPERDEHKLLGQETYLGSDCFVIESTPKDNSQYQKRVSCVDKQSLLILKIDFYNKEGRKSKLLQVKRMEKVSGIWTAMETQMQDLEQQHTTTMKVLEVKYNQGLDDGIFAKENLEK